jgi:outer membrane lipoprotein-sorting protein
MQCNKQISALLFLLCFLAAATTWAQQAATPDLSTILSHMEQAHADAYAHMSPYSLTREYKFFGDDQQHAKSQVLAKVDFAPPNEKNYTIERSSGSGQGEKITRKVLDHEKQMTKGDESGALNRDNYDFEYLRTEPMNGRRAYVLKLTPKHNDKNLIKGLAWIDAETFHPLKIEGEPAKSPSFWVKNLKLSLTFAQVGDMWLQTGTRAVANVRFLGQHTMIARDVNYDLPTQMAALTVPKSAAAVASQAVPVSTVKKRPTRPALGAGASIIGVRRY